MRLEFTSIAMGAVTFGQKGGHQTQKKLCLEASKRRTRADKLAGKGNRQRPNSGSTRPTNNP